MDAFYFIHHNNVNKIRFTFLMTLLNVLLTKTGIAEIAIVLLNKNEHRVIHQFYGYILGYNIKKLTLRNIKYRTLLLTSWLTYILRVTRASTNIKVRLFAYILSIVRFDRLHVRCFSAERTMYHFRMKSRHFHIYRTLSSQDSSN